MSLQEAVGVGAVPSRSAPVDGTDSRSLICEARRWPLIPKPRQRWRCTVSASARAPRRSPGSPRIRAAPCWPSSIEPGAGLIDDPDLLTSAEAAQAGHDFRQVRKAARLAERITRDAEQQAAQQAARNAQQAARHERQPQGQRRHGARRRTWRAGADMKSSRRRRRPRAIPAPPFRSRSFSRRRKPASRPRPAADIGFARAAGLVLVQPFLHLGQQGRRRPAARRRL